MTERTTPSSPPRLDDLLCFLVYSTGFAFNRVYRRQLEQIGLTYPQYLVLIVLWAEDALTVGQVGERVGLDSGTLTPLLKRLETSGLVSRSRSATDERRVIITLTDRGDALRDRAEQVMSCVSDAVRFDASEVSMLMRQMRVLRQNLEKAATSDVSRSPG